MLKPILSDEEREAAFLKSLSPSLSETERVEAREDFDREMAERENARHDTQKHYNRHKGFA